MFLKNWLLELRIILWALIWWWSAVARVTSAKSWSSHSFLKLLEVIVSIKVFWTKRQCVIWHLGWIFEEKIIILIPRLALIWNYITNFHLFTKGRVQQNIVKVWSFAKSPLTPPPAWLIFFLFLKIWLNRFW